MNPKKKKRLGKLARKFVENNYSIERVCGKLMKVLDELPKIKWDFNLADLLPNINHVPPEDLTDTEFIEDLYSNMLKIDLKKIILH